uniref:Reverse transcriptase domain-containing protein n=1 Tax=Heterorhabditis bacteriophora TaxID=37862 RepID=A0A1I7XD57_HETBA
MEGVVVPIIRRKLMEKVDRSLYDLPPLKNEWDYDNFCHRFLDNETFLMKEFADYGYKTLLAEDWMKGTLNWPNCKGFNKQPTDHYMRQNI